MEKNDNEEVKLTDNKPDNENVVAQCMHEFVSREYHYVICSAETVPNKDNISND